MSRAGRIVKRVAIAVVVLMVVLFIVANVALGPIAKRAVELAGPALMGVPVKVETVRVYPLLGIVRVEGLVIGAPKGFSASLAELGHFSANLSTASLLDDTIVVREVIVRDPVVTYELAGTRSNVGAVLEALGSPGDDAKPQGKNTGLAKKVVVGHFLFEGGKVRLATTLTGGKGVVFPLPRVELHDVGKEKQGVSAAEALRQSTVAVAAAVLTTVRDGIAGVAGVGAEAVLAVTQEAGVGLARAEALAGSALRTVGQSVTAAEGLVVGGAKEVGGAAAGALKSVEGLLGKKPKTNTPPPTKNP